MANETEEYLMNKLDEALKQAQGSEDGLSKALCDIQGKVGKLKKAFEEAKESDGSAAGVSSRKEKLFYLLNVLAEWQILLEKKSSVGGLHFAVALSRKLEKMEKTMAGSLPEDGTSKMIKEKQGSKSYYRWSSRTVDRNKVHGFSEKENFMERFVVRRDREVNGFKAIGIFGVAGVGKTTLCQLTMNNERVIKDFFPRIWVCMSKHPEDMEDYREEVLKRMLKCLGVEDQVIEYTCQHQDQDGVRGLLLALRRILKGRRYLIGLDDAWDSNQFFFDIHSESNNCVERFELGFPKQQGGTVIVTSRSEELAKKMVGEENVHPLLPLKDKRSCCKIFQDSAGANLEQLTTKDQIDHLEEMIVSKSGGLPLAAKILGEIMKEELAKKTCNA